MTRVWRPAIVAFVAFAAGIGAVAPAAAAPPPYPVPYNFGVGLLTTALHPGQAPPGSNDWDCTPSAAHPHPVVLVHGTFGNMTDSWQALSPLLANNGYCVFALDYGGSSGNQIQAYGDIPTSAAQLAAFIDRVLAETGASEVDIVGHSQGGMMPRWYIQFLGGEAKVHTLVGLSPSNHGTTFNGLAALARAFPGGSGFLGSLCAACEQQFVGSTFLQTLNADGDTVAGVTYTVIATRYDVVVTPYSSAFLSGPGVTNITVQDGCGLDLTDHLAIIYSRRALRYTLNALDPAHPVGPACTLVLPGVGG